jgi:hypothetical protein
MHRGRGVVNYVQKFSVTKAEISEQMNLLLKYISYAVTR